MICPQKRALLDAYNIEVKMYSGMVSALAEKRTREEFVKAWQSPAKRERKLLLHKAEIIRLGITIKQKGLTLVPLRLYWARNRVKLEIGLAKGKRQYDKREAIAAKDARREMDRATRSRP